MSRLWDNYKPSRITDLVVVNAATDPDRRVTIQFTAPGENLDSGTAFLYEIKYSPVFNDVYGANFETNNSTPVLKEHIMDGSLKPMKSGSTQVITFFLKDKVKADNYFIALRAINNRSQASPASNIISVHLPNKPTTCSEKCVFLYQSPMSICWDKTNFNSTLHKQCPNNFEGRASWTCGADGFWLTPRPDQR